MELFPSNVLAHHQRSLYCLKQDQPIPCRLDPSLAGILSSYPFLKKLRVYSNYWLLVLPILLLLFFFSSSHLII